MSWIKKLFGGSKPRTLLDQVQEAGDKVIVSAYRKLAFDQVCAPTTATSDQEIIDIYKKVAAAFREVSRQRGERLTAGTTNFIVWNFLQVKETIGTEMLESHLEYEIEKYKNEGLRPDYRQDLYLF